MFKPKITSDRQVGCRLQLDQQRHSDGHNREAIYQMLASLTAIAEQLAVASRDLAQHSDATAADQRALIHDVKVSDRLTQTLREMAATGHNLEPFPVTSRITDRLKTAFQLSDQAMQTAMRIAHSTWLPRDRDVAVIRKTRYRHDGRANDGPKGDGG